MRGCFCNCLSLMLHLLCCFSLIPKVLSVPRFFFINMIFWSVISNLISIVLSLSCPWLNDRKIRKHLCLQICKKCLCKYCLSMQDHEALSFNIYSQLLCFSLFPSVSSSVSLHFNLIFLLLCFLPLFSWLCLLPSALKLQCFLLNPAKFHRKNLQQPYIYFRLTFLLWCLHV